MQHYLMCFEYFTLMNFVKVQNQVISFYCNNFLNFMSIKSL
jgi:hypothetical protein